MQICLIRFVNILGVLWWQFYKIIWNKSWLEMMYGIVICLFCTHMTFDLILRLRNISRLGIHPYGCWHTSRHAISIDAKFYSILPSKVKITLFRLNGQPTNIITSEILTLLKIYTTTISLENNRKLMLGI